MMSAISDNHQMILSPSSSISQQPSLSSRVTDAARLSGPIFSGSLSQNSFNSNLSMSELSRIQPHRQIHLPLLSFRRILPQPTYHSPQLSNGNAVAFLGIFPSSPFASSLAPTPGFSPSPIGSFIPPLVREPASSGSTYLASPVFSDASV